MPHMEHIDSEATKHGGTSTKHGGTSTKSQAESVTETYSSYGAFGDYEVTTHEGKPGTLYNAVTVRVLDRGELSLITDTGQWFLFAANAWFKVAPVSRDQARSTATSPIEQNHRP